MQVETSGDAMYMTVSGAPVKNMRHAEAASAMALDILEGVKLIKNPANKNPMTVSIGKQSTKCTFTIFWFSVEVVNRACRNGCPSPSKIRSILDQSVF